MTGVDIQRVAEEFVLFHGREEDFTTLEIEMELAPTDLYAEVPVTAVDDVLRFDEEVDGIAGYLDEVMVVCRAGADD